MDKMVFLITPKQCKTNNILSKNVDDTYITAAIETAQDIYLTSIIGTALYEKICEMVDDNTISNNPTYFFLYNLYITPFLKARVNLELLYNLSFKIRNMGVVRNTDTNINYPSIEEIKYLETQYMVKYNRYCERLSKYLEANEKELPELTQKQPLYYDLPIIGKNFASDAGLYLGGHLKKGCKSNDK